MQTSRQLTGQLPRFLLKKWVGGMSRKRFRLRLHYESAEAENYRRALLEREAAVAHLGKITRRQFVASAVSVTAQAAISVQSSGISQTLTTKGDKVMKLTPYLLFDGKCAEAMEFYKSVFGGELTMTKVKDSPAAAQMQAFQQGKVINAHLQSGAVEISASDWLAVNETPVRGNTVCLFLSGGAFQDLKSIFDKLSEGANVTNPLKELFFGVYGALNDKFGVRWMFQTNDK